MGYNLQETRFGRSYLLGRDEYVDGKHRVKNIPLIDLMDDLGFIPDGKDVNEIYDLSVVWYENDGDIYVESIYDNDSGETYWVDKTNDEWTDNDEELLNSLLMYGGLENTIGELYVWFSRRTW